MSATGIKRRSEKPKRRKSAPKSDQRRATASKLRSARTEEDVLKLVRTGVERFILKKATVEEFLGTIRALSEEETSYAHQLTRSVFKKIVKEAIMKRKAWRLPKS